MCRLFRRPCHALIDPCAQQSDLSLREPRADRRHHFAPGSGNHQDEFAFGAIARLNDAKRGLALVEPESLHLLLRAVAHEAALLEEGLDIASVIDLLRGSRGQVLGYESAEKYQSEAVSQPSQHGYIMQRRLLVLPRSQPSE